MGQQSRAYPFYAFMTGAVTGGGAVAYWESIFEVIYKCYSVSYSFFGNIPPAAINFMTVAGFVLAMIPLAISFFRWMRSKKGVVEVLDPTPSDPNTGKKRRHEGAITHQVIVNGVSLSIPYRSNDDYRSMIGAICTPLVSGTLKIAQGITERLFPIARDERIFASTSAKKLGFIYDSFPMAVMACTSSVICRAQYHWNRAMMAVKALNEVDFSLPNRGIVLGF